MSSRSSRVPFRVSMFFVFAASHGAIRNVTAGREERPNDHHTIERERTRGQADGIHSKEFPFVFGERERSLKPV